MAAGQNNKAQVCHLFVRITYISDGSDGLAVTESHPLADRGRIRRCPLTPRRTTHNLRAGSENCAQLEPSSPETTHSLFRGDESAGKYLRESSCA